MHRRYTQDKGRNGTRSNGCEWGKFVVVGVIIAVILILFHEMHPSHTTENLVQSISHPEAPKHDKTSKRSKVTLDMKVLESIQKVDCDKLRALKKQIVDAKNDIWKTWDVSHYPNFLKIMHIPLSSWNIQKAKFISMLLEGMAGKYREEFVVGFSGSSVTAGHDNYFTEAFPQVFYNRMQPVFQSFNIPLVVRNHAIGNNPCYPYDACIATHLGTDLDILTWEQSMNCGRDWKPLNTFTRTAAVMPKQPTVLYFLSGGPTWTVKECAEKNLTAGNEAQITARTALSTEEQQLLRMSYQDIVTKKVNTLETMEFLNNRDGFRIYERYARFAPMAHSTNSIGEYKCYGPYNYTYSEKTPGAGAPWHPGRVGHQLRGDSLAYALLAILSESVDVVASLTSLDGTIANACKSSTSTSNITPSAAASSQAIQITTPPVVIGNPVIDPVPIELTKEDTNNNTATDTTSSLINKNNLKKRALLISKEEIVNELLSYRMSPTSLLSYVAAASPDTSTTNKSPKVTLEERTMYHKIADRIHSIIHSLPNANVLNDAMSIRVKVLYVYCETLFETLFNNPLPTDIPITNYLETNAIPHCYTDYLPKSTANNLYDLFLHHPNITLKPEAYYPERKEEGIEVDGSDDVTEEELKALREEDSLPIPGQPHQRQRRQRVLIQGHHHHNQRRGLRTTNKDKDWAGEGEEGGGKVDYPMPVLVNVTTNRTITTPFILPGMDWQKELSFFDINGVMKGEEHHLGYLDRKYIYVSTGIGTSIYLLVSVATPMTPIWFCECQKGFQKYPATMSDLSVGAIVIVHSFPRLVASGQGNGYDEKHAASFITKERKETELEVIADQCYRTKTVFPKGDHIVQIVQQNASMINLAYVITW